MNRPCSTNLTQQQLHYFCRCCLWIVCNQCRHQHICIYHSVYHTVCCFFRRVPTDEAVRLPLRCLPSLAARISALISSSVISGSVLASAALRCRMNRSSALGCSVLPPLMVKGMLRLLTTAFTKMLKAVFALMPNCSQSSSNCDFISDSILTVTADCAIIQIIEIVNYDSIMLSFRLQKYTLFLILPNYFAIIFTISAYQSWMCSYLASFPEPLFQSLFCNLVSFLCCHSQQRFGFIEIFLNTMTVIVAGG